MAGMLPGVECARRRRFHQSSGCIDSSNNTSSFSSTRRSSFCLYTSNHEYPLNSSSSKQQRGATIQAYQDEKLGEVAREAKQRLDERLSARWKSQNHKRSLNDRQPQNQGQGMMVEINRPNLQGDQVFFGLKRSGSKKFNWGKMIWKSQEQDECAICLDKFKIGDNLMQLTCAHKFHSKCLVPWLECNAHCPCCRMTIILTSSTSA